MTTLAVMHNDDNDSIPPSSLAGVWRFRVSVQVSIHCFCFLTVEIYMWNDNFYY
jgi:hypothetical protein